MQGCVAEQSASSSMTAMLLNGFHVAMHCVEDGVCNSNASWITAFAINITSFDPRTCLVLLDCTLNRAWSVGGGGGKPFSEHMHFTVTVDYLLVLSNQTGATHVVDSIVQHGDIFDPIANVTRTVDGTFSPGNTLVALRAFSWQIFETDDIPDIGRYFEAVYFMVGPLISVTSDHVAYNVTMDILAPKATTFPAKLFKSMDVVVLSVPGVAVGPGNRVTGNICESSASATFKCAWVDMAEQLSDTVTVLVDLP